MRGKKDIQRGGGEVVRGNAVQRKFVSSLLARGFEALFAPVHPPSEREKRKRKGGKWGKRGGGKKKNLFSARFPVDVAKF